MKNKLVVSIISAIGALSASAATTITATNASAPFATGVRQIQNTVGSVTAGIAATSTWSVGVFAGNTFTTSTTLLDFTAAGSATFTPGQLGVFGALGGTGISIDLPNTGEPAGDFVGRPMYVVIARPGSATEFIAFSTPATFQFENTLNVGAPVGVSSSQLNLVKGFIIGTNTGLTGAAAAGNGSATAINFVPEPSAALLGALGVLGLLRRRRI